MTAETTIESLDDRASDPGFLISDSEVRAEWARMCAEPVELDRPVVTIAGWRAFWTMSIGMKKWLLALTGAPEEMIRPVAYPFIGGFEGARNRLLHTIDRHWPNDDPARTSEVDVVGVSMGGLVSRYAASGLDGNERKASIVRLFTLGTPHRGARLAKAIAPDRAAQDMKPGSKFLERLNDDLPNAAYELICYARMADGWVGAQRTAPPGHAPLWRKTPNPLEGHLTISRDRRIMLDIARRLRGEEPLVSRRCAPPRN